MNVAENVHDHRVIVAELELGNRHKGQSLGNKPDRHGSSITRTQSSASIDGAFVAIVRVSFRDLIV